MPEFYPTVTKCLQFVIFIIFLWGSSIEAQPTDHDRTPYDQSLSEFENWIMVNQYVLDEISKVATEQKREESYRLLAKTFTELFHLTNNTNYLLFALHELDSEGRQKLINNIDSDKLREIDADIKKLIDREFVEDYFRDENFSASGIYKFQGTSLPERYYDLAFNILDEWFEKLPETYQKNPTEGTLKAYALANAYFRFNDYNSVNALITYLGPDSPLPVSYRTLAAYKYVAFSSTVSGHFRDALNYYREVVIPVAEELGDIPELMIVRMDYANVLFRLGNMSAALQEYELIFRQEEFLTHQNYRAALFNNLAISYLNAGSFDQYVEFQLSAYEIARTENNLNLQLSILRNLHIVYRLSQNPELALNYINEALDIAIENDLTKEISSILISLGVYNREILFDYEAALDYLYRALEITEELNDYFELQGTYIEIARTYQSAEDYKNSEAYFLKAAEINKQRSDDLALVTTSIRLANMFLSAGQHETASLILEDFDEFDFERLRFTEMSMMHNVRHKIMLEEGKYEDAYESSAAHIRELKNWLKGSADSQTGQMLMEREFTEAYRIHMELLHELGKASEMIGVNEQLRSISRSAFFNNPLLKSSMLSDEELLQDYALGNRIQRLRGELAESTGQERIEIGNELLESINRRNQLLNQIIRLEEVDSESVDPRQIRRALGRNEKVIYFSIFGNHIFQIEITRSGITSRRHNSGRTLISRIEEVRDTFKPGQTDLSGLYELYSAFFGESEPADYDMLYIVPDGLLYQVPFEILPVSKPNSSTSYGSSTYLIEKTSISYVNTIADLFREQPAIQPTYDLSYAGFGISDFAAAGHSGMSNLPFAAIEINSTKARLTNLQPAVSFINEEVTKRAFNRVAGTSRILHLATHSIVENKNPLFSALYLHADNPVDSDTYGDDGIIRAYNLFEMNMTTDLVVLSSCESASGDYLEGSGILGLSRAFTYAGAQSLLMNLWPVKDQTASHITGQFFQYLDEGNAKPVALRKARLDYLNTINSDPFLWGGYVLHGNTTPLQRPVFFSLLYVQVGLMLLGLGLTVLIVLMYRKRSLKVDKRVSFLSPQKQEG